MLLTAKVMFYSLQITGAACIILGLNPNLTPTELKEQIINSATPNKVINPGYGSPNRLLYIGAQQLRFRPTVSRKTNMLFKTKDAETILMS